MKKRRMESNHIPSCGMEAEEELKKEILKKQNELIEESINKIKSGKYGRQTGVFKMKDMIGGSKKPKQEAHVVLDSETGGKVVSVEDIKRVNLKEVLKHNSFTAEAEKLVNIEANMHKRCIKKRGRLKL